MTRILLIGEDPAILTRRAEMLRQPGIEVACCLTAQFDDAWVAQEPFDLVILCHTVHPHVEAAMLTAEIFRHWRQTPVLRIVKGTGELPDDSGVDANLVIGKPGQVVDIALKMLGKAPTEQPAAGQVPGRQPSSRAA